MIRYLNQPGTPLSKKQPFTGHNNFPAMITLLIESMNKSPAKRSNNNNKNRNSNKAHAAVTVVPVKQKRILSSDEINELVYYEELDYNDDSLSNPYNRTVRSMYNKVPLNPFKATVRTSKASKLDDLGVVDSVNHNAGVVCSYNDSSNASTRSLGSFPQALKIVTTTDQLRLSIYQTI